MHFLIIAIENIKKLFLDFYKISRIFISRRKKGKNKMTKTHEFILGKTDSSGDFEGHILDVEYVISSVSDDVKVVDMWRYWDSKNHNHSTLMSLMR